MKIVLLILGIVIYEIIGVLFLSWIITDNCAYNCTALGTLFVLVFWPLIMLASMRKDSDLLREFFHHILKK